MRLTIWRSSPPLATVIKKCHRVRVLWTEKRR
nr:MAG TPA: hypothetical protein [Caudoviricetes sp.]